NKVTTENFGRRGVSAMRERSDLTTPTHSLRVIFTRTTCAPSTAYGCKCCICLAYVIAYCLGALVNIFLYFESSAIPCENSRVSACLVPYQSGGNRRSCMRSVTTSQTSFLCRVCLYLARCSWIQWPGARLCT